MSLPLSPDAVRSGAFASLLFAIVALTANMALPFLLQSSKTRYEVSEGHLPAPLLSRIVNHPRLGIQPAWTGAHFFFRLWYVRHFCSQFSSRRHCLGRSYGSYLGILALGAICYHRE